MNQEQLQQKITEYFQKLPKESQDVFSSMVWMETLKNINTKHNLNEKQIEILGTETTLALLGIIHLEEYIDILQKELQVSEEILDEIIVEVDEKIFKTIKGQLVDTYEANVLSLEKESTPKEEKLDTRFINLPKEVQEAITKSGWKEKLYEIASKYKLNIEQMGILEDVTVKVMLNTIHPDKYEEELTSKITISKEDISNIVKDINENILKKIREIMEVKKEVAPVEIKDDVPVPPYAGTIKNYELGIKNEEKTPNTTEKPIITNKPIAQPVNQPNKDNSQNIMNIVEEKLRNATVSDHTISDHSNSSAKSADPYREII